jgi:antitoxin VapB
MAILIRDEETDTLIRMLAARTGETMTDAVKHAVRDRLQRMPISDNEIAARKRKLAKLFAASDAMPTVDHRSADDILGYNVHGHFD